jgi:hypothetical protein
MIRSVSFSWSGEPGQQIDFDRGASPDGMAVWLQDGTTIFVGERDGYPTTTVWAIDVDGADIGELPLQYPTVPLAQSGSLGHYGADDYDSCTDEKHWLVINRIAPESETEMRMAHGDR